MSNEQALNEFVELNAQTITYMKRMIEHFENHCDEHPDNINWGHVGDAGYNLDQIKNVHDRIFKEGEYK